jgi:tRNA(Arg) A34 adenosine deaminase TadA
MTTLGFALPVWLDALNAADIVLPEVGARAAFAVDLARRNVQAGTGGPFGAAVFERDTGRMLAAGVNLVATARCSVLHAEMVALMTAQARLGQYDLAAGPHALELVTSCEPCAMCYGAIPWSGVKRLICCARDEDARAVGFDEGDKRDDWRACLERRGVAVLCDLHRDDAAQVLRDYQTGGGAIYNGGCG